MRQLRPVLLWFRRDLRLRDHPALRRALQAGAAVIPVYVWDPEGQPHGPPGGAARGWLHHSLESLDAALRTRGSRLVLRRGGSLAELLKLAQETGARRIVAHAHHESVGGLSEDQLWAAGRAAGVEIEFVDGCLLTPPRMLQTRAGGPYRVFTPYWRSLLTRRIAAPLASPRNLRPVDSWPASLSLPELGLLPGGRWADDFARHWSPGEAGAQRRLGRVLSSVLAGYETRREVPAREGTSRLSPHLHFGEVNVRQVWQRVLRHAQSGEGGPAAAGAEAFLRQLAWREFAHHLLVHFPESARQALRPEFERFPWRQAPAQLRRWQTGSTGYPIVDAGMRQLWQSGWMHNRVRMLAASFLTKDLLIRWQSGADWFWDRLVDADLANNTLGWQWVAGCGADAAPYFRVFNPVTQGERFDPQGEYVRRFVPELERMPAAYIHRPHLAPREVLARAGVKLGVDYPRPMVDHAQARDRALAAYQRLRGS